MQITKAAFPFIVLARREIEMDGGGHLIGTVYPGEPLDMATFEVPDGRWLSVDLCKAEVALLWLYAVHGHDAFSNFCCGDQLEQDAFIEENRDVVHRLRIPADLELAHKFLNDYFNSWSD
jgi:hypothetical protein